MGIWVFLLEFFPYDELLVFRSQTLTHTYAILFVLRAKQNIDLIELTFF